MPPGTRSSIRQPPRWLPIALAALALTACSDRDGRTEAPVAAGSRTPHLSPTADGRTVLSWLEPAGDAMALRFSVLDDGNWSDATTVASGSDWFVNWADFPSVTPITERLWAAHWLVKRPGGTYAYDVAVALSDDGGRRWGAPVTPHDDGTPTEHGFVTLFPDDGGAGVLWLDGRNMAGNEGGMTLRTVTLDAGGSTRDAARVDALVCDCCQTDVALTDTGPVAVYRNRTEDEIRDIYVARRVDGAWQSGTTVADDGWEIAGCPVNGPTVDAGGAHVAVAWFTGADNRPRVRATLSTDSGASFTAPFDIDAQRPVGRVDVVLLDDDRALITWLAHAGDGVGELRARTIAADGSLGPARVIARTESARASGFPQAVRAGDDVVFAWTEIAEKTPRVHTAVVDAGTF